MPKLELSVVFGDYDRTRPLLDGKVQIDGVSPIFMTLSPEEMFFRAFRTSEFDITELSLSSYLIKISEETCPYVAVPVFLSRAFRHTSIYVRRDRIQHPSDLRGCRIGIPEYQLTAVVWARALLQDEFGIRPQDVTWVRGGIHDPGRPEKLKLILPEGVRLEDAPQGDTISSMLDRGHIDAFIAPRAPSCSNPQVGWLFPDPVAAAMEYYERTQVFPIMHVVGVRRELANKHRWLPGAVLKAFTEAKSAALEHLSDTSATKVTLPFIEEQLSNARRLMGHDFWSYGVQGNETTLETFLKHHHTQGLSRRQLKIEEIFHPSTYEVMKI